MTIQQKYLIKNNNLYVRLNGSLTVNTGAKESAYNFNNEEKIWNNKQFEPCPEQIFFVKLSNPNDKTTKNKITNIFFGLDNNRSTVAGSVGLKDIPLNQLKVKGYSIWGKIKFSNVQTDCMSEYNRYIAFDSGKDYMMDNNSRLLYRNQYIGNGTLQKIGHIVTPFKDGNYYYLYYFDPDKYIVNTQYTKYVNASYKTYFDTDEYKNGPWRKLFLPQNVLANKLVTNATSSNNETQLAPVTISEQEYKQFYAENNGYRSDDSVTNQDLSVYQSIKNVDIDQDGFLLDYEAVTEANPEANPQYLHNNGVSNDNVFKVSLEHFCMELWKDDKPSESVYNWKTKYKESTNWNVPNNVYLLFDSVDPSCPLYSPELITACGIGYIRSDWIGLDEKGCAVVKWWPERSLQHMIQESDCNKNDYKDYYHITDLKKYNESNPLIGRIFSYRTADYLLGDDNTTKDYYNIQQDDYDLVPKKSVTKKDESEKEYKNTQVIKPIINPKWTPSNKPGERIIWRIMELIGLTEYSDKGPVYIHNWGKQIKQLAYWKYEKSEEQNVLHYISDSKRTAPNGTVNLTYRFNDYANEGQVQHADSGEGYIEFDRYYVFYDITEDTQNKVKSGSTNFTTQVGYPVNWTDTRGRIVWAAMRTAEPDESNAEEELETMIREQPEIWKTPREFYGSIQNNQNFEESEDGYMKIEVNETNSKYTNWWWCNTLRNWCLFLYTSAHKVNLYVWNGRNGWENFEAIAKNIKYGSIRRLKKEFHYNPEIFDWGISYSEYTDRDKHFGDCKIIYDVLKLTRDSVLATWDDNSFQNVHCTKHHYDNGGTGYYPATTQGAVPILRLSNHELGLCYRFSARGRTRDQDMLRPDSIPFVNSCCVAYFGSGDDKTIEKDWKRNYVNWDEEKGTSISLETEETLYNSEHINTSIKDDDGLSITFSAPRPNVLSKDSKNTDYALRWE